jgi:FlaA1/EpsC-like NDP-sugar epimerase
MNLLITGGTGSLGQALVREALKMDFHSIRVYSRNEYYQWLMRQNFKDERIRYMIGDVRDCDRLKACLKGVDFVIHAAALKHISTGQYNPQEVIKTNVGGSVNIVDACAYAGVKKVLGISSDKAVAPSCLYGSTKQIMETLFMEANNWAAPATIFSCLRSGNFFESRGNVFEVWNKEYPTGILTLTNEVMSRYFIHTQEVAKLALKILAIMEGKEIFIPKMTEYNMLDLIKEFYPKASVRITGRTQGEKFREVLFSEDERPEEHENYYVIHRN